MLVYFFFGSKVPSIFRVVPMAKTDASSSSILWKTGNMYVNNSAHCVSHRNDARSQMRIAQTTSPAARPTNGQIKFGSTNDGEMAKVIADDTALIKRTIAKTTPFIRWGARVYAIS